MGKEIFRSREGGTSMSCMRVVCLNDLKWVKSKFKNVIFFRTFGFLLKILL